MTEAIYACSLESAGTFLLTGMLFEIRLKPINARCTVGPGLWQKRTIFFIRKRGGVNFELFVIRLYVTCREVRRVACGGCEA